MVKVSETCDPKNVVYVIESMAMGKRKAKQRELWVSTNEIPKAASHPFYAKVNEVLERHQVDRRLEHLCRRFYKPTFGRPSISPGVYFRLLLIGFFEGIDSERGIAVAAGEHAGGEVDPGAEHAGAGTEGCGELDQR